MSMARYGISALNGLLVLFMTMSATGMTVNAASPKTVKTVTVRADEKNVTQKTYTLEIGKSKSLKVTAKPTQAVKSIRYQSNKPKTVAVNKKGKVTSKRKGTAKIQITVTGKNKILVAYFLATNTTEKVAGYIAGELLADLYEIVPEVPYTDADLNYRTGWK